MSRLALAITDIENVIPHCETQQEVERRETTKDVLQNKLDDNQGYYEEFRQTALKMTKDLDNIIGDNLGHKGMQHALLHIDDSRRRLNREGRRLRNPLPIYGRRTEILNAVTNPSTRACVIQAETGSGKSTQVPQYLMEFLQSQTSSNNIEKGIVCTQPRPMAAITLAQRIAEEYDCEVGHEVGFVAGNKKKVSNKTLATFMTDRTLINFCLTDPKYIGNYSYVVIDEAHERSVDTDILLAMLKKEQIDNNKQFTIIIMSATIDVDLFSRYFDGCPVIEIPGRTFPVDIEWCSEGQTFGNDDYVTRAVETSYDIHVNEDIEGDILVFLTSQVEIDRACRNLRRKLGITQGGHGDDNVDILPLHGKLQPNDLFKVLKKTRNGIRKIVFATNIAETSVTIPGVKYVIDTGMVKELQYDTKKSMSMLKVTNVTQASAEQRKGRAGRTGPGKCYRLYSHEEFQEMDQSMKPEILRVHLGMTVMKLLQMGVRDVDKFDFVESPEPGAIEQAMKTLILLGAVKDEDRTLTDVGNAMVKLPVEPRLAKLILEGAKEGFLKMLLQWLHWYLHLETCSSKAELMRRGRFPIN
ncbi:ATP-dependent RNA helicase DHX15-like [Amphiura filiformis]|uniref:ATP-dependent RNA helicase DHX15-like n=1 Tax=Amphiura filiformis TaxID=82378 RepID=UPI003B2281ED